MNIKQNFCSYQISKDLKELGFDEECLASYYCFREDDNSFSKPEFHINGEQTLDNREEERNQQAYHDIKVPLLQQALCFLREKYNIIIEVHADCSQLNFEYGYNWYIWNRTTSEEKWSEQTSTPKNCPIGEWSHSDYNECLIQAIEESVKLIKSK